MKNILVLLTITLSAITGFSQSSTYYKAFFLKQEYNSVLNKITLDNPTRDVLKLYYPANTNITVEVLNQNPFFKNLFEEKPGSGIKSFRQIASTVGGANVTNIANGVADLMIERAKEELTISFFNKLKNYSENHPEFQILFPKTADNLINLLAHTYPQMLPLLRSGFNEDLNMLPYHLSEVFELPKYSGVKDTFPEIGILIETLGEIQNIEKESHNAAQVMNSIAHLRGWDQANGSINFKNAATAVKLSNIISQSLRAADTIQTKPIWVSQAQTTSLIKDSIFLKVYLGLIYQEISLADLRFYSANNPNGESVTQAILNTRETIFWIKSKIKDFGVIAEKANATLNALKSKKSESLTDQDYYDYINTSLEAIDFVLGIAKTFDPRLKPDAYLSVARKANTIYKNIYSKNYAIAIGEVVELFKEVKEIIETENTRMTKTSGYKTPENFEALCSFMEKVRPFAVFIASVADAQSSDDVKHALENAILPAGSSSIKKYTKNNLSLQAYLGAFALTSDPAKTPNSIWADKFGVTAPIGLAYTPGFLSGGKNGSLSLFIPVFDIGAIVDHKLKLDSAVNSSTGKNESAVSSDYTINLGQIVSPGVFVVYGFFGNLPLSLGFGAQYGPSLSKIDADSNAVINQPSWRWNMFLAVDLPFFNLANRTKYKR